VNKLANYFAEVKIELCKAQWPWRSEEHGFKKYQELWNATLVVIIAMLLMGGYLAFFDFITLNVVGFLTRP
jgi:preprotein translocase subunit SecE